MSAGYALAAVLALTGTHVVADRLGPVRGGGAHRRLVSGFGGAAVAYVFLHLLPHLAAGNETLASSAVGELPGDAHAYLLAFAGLSAYYGIELATRASRRRSDHGGTELGTFVGSTTAFAAYNFLLGYLVGDWLDGLGPVAGAGLVVVLCAHLAINDASLLEHHRDRYERSGRWVIAAAPPLGWVLLQVAALPDPVLAAAVSLLAGALILNALKEELPAEGGGRFGPFVAGGVLASAALLFG